MKKTVAVDLDGVLAHYDHWRGVDHFGSPVPGAREFLKNLGLMAKVVIHTARISDNQSLSPGQVADLVREWLDSNGLPYDRIHTGAGKPVASAYVDDRAVVCKPQYKPAPGAEFALALDRCQDLIGKDA